MRTSDMDAYVHICVSVSAGYVQYDQLKPLVSRVGFIKTEKDEAKNFEVRQSSLQVRSRVKFSLQNGEKMRTKFHSNVCRMLRKPCGSL